MSVRGNQLRLATRGSELARWQASLIEEQLTQRRLSVECVEVETTGDQLRDELIHQLGTTGAFVRSLDQQVLDGDVDAAVHSMKDMPTDQPDDLVVAAVPERAAAGDVLLTPDGTELEALPAGAMIGTSSLRRGAQLLAERPDLEIEPLRGNVDTRVEKLLAPSLQREHERRLEAEEGEEGAYDAANDHSSAESAFDRSAGEWFDALSEIERQALGREVETEYDAICLAEAGLARSGLLRHLEYERLDPTRIVPAPAQGAIAVTAVDGEVAERINDIVDHPPTRIETTVERTVLAELGGGCVAPVGIHAKLQGQVLNTAVRVLSQDGTEQVRGTRELPVDTPVRAARDFAAHLADQGAAELIEQARRSDPDDAKRA